jgi:VirE N-terminal domain/Primase C terminal 2 (PriCT-2)
MNIQDLQKFLERHSWTFAKTMTRNPHWYIVRDKSSDQVVFDEAVHKIQRDGVTGDFEGVAYKYLSRGDYKYWTMVSSPEDAIIINRVPTITIANKEDFINATFIFSLYPNLVTADKPSANIDINQLIEVIKYGYIKDIIFTLRGPIPKQEYDQIKKESIPCVTLSGTFTHRDRKNLVNHSGLMQVDIDKVEDYDATFSKLCKDEYIYVCFRSPGGNGIKVIVKINPSADTHKSQFQALEIYFKTKFGIIIDSMCKDLARAMLLSYDPDIYCNPRANVFEEMYVENVNERKAPRGPQLMPQPKGNYHDEDIDVVERLIAALEGNGIDITNTYENWIKVGFALGTTFGENGREYYHRIGRMYPLYTPEETDRTYTLLLARNNGKTKIASIIYLAKEAGVRIKKNGY